MLDLSELGDGLIPAITPAVGNMLAEGAGVCLESQGHAQGVELFVSGGESDSYPLTWTPVTEQALRAWADERYATKHGAEAISVLLAIHDLGYAEVEASRQGTGIDYWLESRPTTYSSQREGSKCQEFGGGQRVLSGHG